MRSCLVVLFGLFLAACQPISVNTQSDPNVDLNSYRSYDWLLEKREQMSEDRELLIKQFKFAVEQELAAKGINKTSVSPDFLISFYGSAEQRTAQRVVETGDYWGDRRRYPYYTDPDSRDYDRKYKDRLGGTYTRTIESQTIEYKEGHLVVEFLDNQTKELIWQARVQTVIDEQDTAGMIQKIAQQVIAKFPN